MIKGLVGEKLIHSYSKIIHEEIANDIYNLYSLNKQEFETFFQEKSFNFVNVTIPYKEKVIPYLDNISSEAKRIGAVNLVVNKNNELFGYNTDYYGFKYLLEYNNVNVKNKKCLILGTGGTSKTVKAVLEDSGASLILKASRNKTEEFLSYDEIYNYDFEIIVNTTPVGMYPNINNTIIDLSRFTKIEFIADCIYNPLRTKLLLDAEELNIKYASGLRMLIYQAIVAHEIAMQEKVNQDIIEKIYKKISQDKCNIVLIGMPGSGKTTIAEELGKRLKKEVIDIDKYIVGKAKMTIEDIFNKYSENYFRALETDACKEVALMTNVIISTGGGVIKNKDNIDYLKGNGVVFYLDRSVDNIYNTIYQKIKNDDNRPLLKSKDDLLKLFNERNALYQEYADVIIDNNDTLEKSVKGILENKNW